MHRGLRGYGCTGTLTIGTTLLNTAAWDIPDLTPLWIEHEVVGDDADMPGTTGVVPYQKFMTAARFALPMLISGDVDELGVDYANAWVGLETNIETLRAAIVAPTGTGDGTRAATLTMPSGATRTADVHVLKIATSGSVGAGSGAHSLMRAVLQLSIPSGRFA